MRYLSKYVLEVKSTGLAPGWNVGDEKEKRTKERINSVICWDKEYLQRILLGRNQELVYKTHVSEVTILCTFNLYNAVCQSYLSKTGGETKAKWTEIIIHAPFLQMPPSLARKKTYKQVISRQSDKWHHRAVESAYVSWDEAEKAFQMDLWAAQMHLFNHIQ